MLKCCTHEISRAALTQSATPDESGENEELQFSITIQRFQEHLNLALVRQYFFYKGIIKISFLRRQIYIRDNTINHRPVLLL